MTKFFNIFKKPCFWPIFDPFSQCFGQKKFFQKIRLCHAKLHMGFQHHAKIQKKLIIQFQENGCTDGSTDGRTDGRKERQTLFHKTLPANAGGPTRPSTPASTEVLNKGYASNLSPGSFLLFDINVKEISIGMEVA